MNDWLAIARAEKGVKERPGTEDNPRIIEYLRTVDLAGIGKVRDEIPWCSAFVNWVLLQCGIKGTDSPAARSWLGWGEMCAPQIGALGIMRRGSSVWQGHVGFVTGIHGGYVQLLGGNQSDEVSERLYPMADFIGFRMPRRLQPIDMLKPVEINDGRLRRKRRT